MAHMPELGHLPNGCWGACYWAASSQWLGGRCPSCNGLFFEKSVQALFKSIYARHLADIMIGFWGITSMMHGHNTSIMLVYCCQGTALWVRGWISMVWQYYWEGGASIHAMGVWCSNKIRLSVIPSIFVKLRIPQQEIAFRKSCISVIVLNCRGSSS